MFFLVGLRLGRFVRRLGVLHILLLLQALLLLLVLLSHFLELLLVLLLNLLLSLLINPLLLELPLQPAVKLTRVRAIRPVRSWRLRRRRDGRSVMSPRERSPTAAA